MHDCLQRLRFRTKPGNEQAFIMLIELLWMRYGPLMNIVRSGVLSRTGQVRHAEAIDAIREGNRRRRPLRSRPIFGKPQGRSGTLFQSARPNWKRQEL